MGDCPVERVPGAAGSADNESREFFSSLVAGAKAAHREDIRGCSTSSNLDDYVTSVGGPDFRFGKHNKAAGSSKIMK